MTDCLSSGSKSVKRHLWSEHLRTHLRLSVLLSLVVPLFRRNQCQLPAADVDEALVSPRHLMRPRLRPRLHHHVQHRQWLHRLHGRHLAAQLGDGASGGGGIHVTQGRSRMIMDPRTPYNAGTEHAGFSTTRQTLLAQAIRAVRCLSSRIKGELHPSRNR